jgi:type II secretory pathway pseudopilin PulG
MNVLRNKGQKGITLIALVVTIIVLLILAGISITMLMGQKWDTK